VRQSGPRLHRDEIKEYDGHGGSTVDKYTRIRAQWHNSRELPLIIDMCVHAGGDKCLETCVHCTGVHLNVLQQAYTMSQPDAFRRS